jgi:hypothetical protein
VATSPVITAPSVFIVGVGKAVGVALGVAVGMYTAGDEAAGISARGRGQALIGAVSCRLCPGEDTAVAFPASAGPAATSKAARESTAANRIMFLRRITSTNQNRGGALLKVISCYAWFVPGKKKKSGKVRPLSLTR